MSDISDCRGVLECDAHGDLVCPKCGFKPAPAPPRAPTPKPDTIESLRQQLAAALAERDRDAKDSARLDWLESHFATGGGMDYAGLDHPDWPDSVEWSDAQDRNFRSLIDAAIAAGGEETGS